MGLIAWIALISACQSDFPPLEIEEDGDRLRLTGAIDRRAIGVFEEAISAHPNVTHLVFDFVPGSLDDESNIKLARIIRERGLNTIIPPNGLTASGGTDLFLAGLERKISPGACVGVHTWGDEDVGIGSETPKDDPVHQFYIDYYSEVEIPEDFYWFTLDAAGPYETHWMTKAEIERYQLTAPLDESRDHVLGEDLSPECEIRLETGFVELFQDQ